MGGSRRDGVRRGFTNTVKKRTHSLFRQGLHYYASIPTMKQEQLEKLVQRFGEYILREAVYVNAFGLAE